MDTKARNKAADNWAKKNGKTVTERTGPHFRCDADSQVYEIKPSKTGWDVSKKQGV